MHFYFAKYNHEIAIVSVGLSADYIQKLSGEIPVYSEFHDLPKSVSSVAVISNHPIDETLLSMDRNISYIFIGIKIFIVPPSPSIISLCVEDDKSLQSIFEAICASDENRKAMNIDPLEPDINGKRFHYIADIPLQKLASFDFYALKETESLWFHQRSLNGFESITDANSYVKELPNFLCYSGIRSDENQLRIIGLTEASEALRPNFPITFMLAGVEVVLKVGDIADESCDAIVNSANIYLKRGSGVCGAVFAAAGARLKNACEELVHQHGGTLQIGQSVITDGFNLKAKQIIHSVSPRCMFQWSEKIQKAFYDTYNGIFEIAQKEGFESIAIPAMGIGKHYCNLDRCTMVLLSVLDEYLCGLDKSLKRVVFVLSDEHIAQKYLHFILHSSHYEQVANHYDGFEEEAKFHRALRYMLARNPKFSTKQLKHILRIFDPSLVDRLFAKKECRRLLEYIGESNHHFTNEKIYQSTTFNGATYEVEDDNGNIVTIGYAYFEIVKEAFELNKMNRILMPLEMKIHNRYNFINSF